MYIVMLFAPHYYFHKHRYKVCSLFCEPVKYFGFAFRMLFFRDQTRHFQECQAISENVGGYFLLRVEELAVSTFLIKDEIPDDQQRPPVAKDIQRSADRALRTELNLFLHLLKVTIALALCK